MARRGGTCTMASSETRVDLSVVIKTPGLLRACGFLIVLSACAYHRARLVSRSEPCPRRCLHPQPSHLRAPRRHPCPPPEGQRASASRFPPGRLGVSGRRVQVRSGSSCGPPPRTTCSRCARFRHPRDEIYPRIHVSIDPVQPRDADFPPRDPPVTVQPQPSQITIRPWASWRRRSRAPFRW